MQTGVNYLKNWNTNIKYWKIKAIGQTGKKRDSELLKWDLIHILNCKTRN